MPRTINLVQHVQIASPCTMSWDAMTGDDRVRHCSHCQLNVFNFQEMTEAEAERLIIEKEGRLCARIYRRYDGTILTKDCPVGLRAVRKRAVWLAMRAAAAVAFIVVSASYAINGRRDVDLDMGTIPTIDGINAQRSTYLTTRQAVERWITATPPPPQSGPVAGGMCILTPPPPPTPTGSASPEASR